MNILQGIVDATRADVAARRSRVSLDQLEQAAAARSAMRPFAGSLRGPGLSVVAEHKRRSPSAGTLREGSSVEEVVTAYERAGAAALSILTDEPHFGGSLEDLRAARRTTGLPVLRKDFIVDSYQVYESAAVGADAVLLIVAALEPSDLARLHDLARTLALDVLVEVHDEAELAQAAAVGAEVIGINNRDLTDFSVDVGRTLTMLPAVPPEAVVISESGLSSPEQLNELEAAGVHAVLIGETLMRAPDPEQALRSLARRPRRCT